LLHFDLECGIVKAELRHRNDKFIVKHSFTKPLMRPRKGRKGEQQSGFVMLLLYKHFSDLGISGKYSKIAALLNSFSHEHFKHDGEARSGVPLNEAKVKQYIMRTRKKQDAVIWCDDFLAKRKIVDVIIPAHYLDEK